MDNAVRPDQLEEDFILCRACRPQAPVSGAQHVLTMMGCAPARLRPGGFWLGPDVVLKPRMIRYIMEGQLDFGCPGAPTGPEASSTAMATSSVVGSACLGTGVGGQMSEHMGPSLNDAST
ncbi:unnamed protein product [Pleuronectes platessa]|uniref:Uncharacterized protein n=1 Tax=Pleuronectes platessa TaxID=8262 RepID=A0A9N7YKR2_PLEPL|nr:unnamed protein product [Pleuronectes platessa]